MKKSQTKTFTYENAEGEEIEVEIPSTWEICGSCRGDGARALGGEAITSSEWAEWDHDDQETYMSGGYDEHCGDCNGTGKLLIPDLDALERSNPEAYKAWIERAQGEAKDRASRRMEERYGG